MPVALLPLTGLEPREVHQMATALSTQAASEAAARTIHAETDGNPLLVAELVRHLAASDALSDQRLGPQRLREFGVPAGLRESTVARAQRLGAEALTALSAASIAGPDFSTELVAAAAELDPAELTEVLSRAAAVGLILEQPRRPGRYTFTHALIRDAFASEVEPGRSPAYPRAHRRGPGAAGRGARPRPHAPRASLVRGGARHRARDRPAARASRRRPSDLRRRP